MSVRTHFRLRRRLRTPAAALLLFGALVCYPAPAEAPPAGPRVAFAESRSVVIREHVRERLDGRYLGQTRSETQVVLRPLVAAVGPNPVAATRSELPAPSPGLGYQGTEIRIADTIRDRHTLGRAVETSREFAFSLDPDRRRRLGNEYVSLPSIWGFPSPAEPGSPYADPGEGPAAAAAFTLPQIPYGSGRWDTAERWEARGEYEVMISPEPGRAERSRVVLPFTAAYRYQGREIWQGRPAHRVEAGFRLRYPLAPMPDFAYPEQHEREEAYREHVSNTAAEAGVAAFKGTHKAVILVSVTTGEPLMINEELSQRIRLESGEHLARDGFRLYWFRRAAPLDEAAVRRRLEEAAVPGLRLETRGGGVALIIEAIGFEPDSAALRPEERERLTEIAALLEPLRGHTILAIGHTADVGAADRRQRLSEERAAAVVRALSEHGIDPERLLYEGRGGREPIADNATAEGRRRNRRVELIILADADPPETQPAEKLPSPTGGQSGPARAGQPEADAPRKPRE